MEDKARFIVKSALEQGFDEVLAMVTDARMSYLKITNSKVDSIVDKYDESAFLYVASKNRILMTSIEELGEASIKAKVKEAKQAIGYVKPKTDYYGLAEGPFKYAFSAYGDKEIKFGENGKMADIANTAVNEALDNGATNVAGTLHMSYSKMSLASSKNVDAEATRSKARLSLRAFSEYGSYQDNHMSPQLNGLAPMKLGQDVAEMSRSMKERGRVDNGTYDIIYMPSPGGHLLTHVTSFACMGDVEQGSVLTDKMDKQVADKGLSIYDVGDSRDVVLTLPFDDEGHPTQTTPVLVNGVLKNYLHNYSTAKKYGTKSTGNAGLVDPSSNTMFMKHKKTVKDLDALIKDVKKGILVTNGWYTRYSNYLTGDFSTMPRDLTVYVEKGERKYSIKQGDVNSMVGIRISDNMLRMISSIDKTTKEAAQTTSWDADGDPYVSPAFVVRGAKVTAV